VQSHLHDLRSEVDDQAIVDRFARDWRTAGLDRATKSLLAYAEKLTKDPAGCGGEDVAILEQNGWDDRAIHDAAQIVAYFNYINRIADGLGVEPEDWIDLEGRVL
jgi:uncharacterized peroxidase-related enzyme